MDFDFADPPKGESFELVPDGFVVSAKSRRGWVWLVLFLAIGRLLPLQFDALHRFNLGQIDLIRLSATSLLTTIAVLAGTLMALLQVLGSVALRRSGDAGSVFVGVGRIGWIRRFSWIEIDSVREMAESRRWGTGPTNRFVELHFRDGRSQALRFGTLLTNERRWFMLAVLRSQLAPHS
jgi:hypothetical protein